MKSDATSPVTIPSLHTRKSRGEKIVALTAYDYIMALLLDEAGVDVILVGDSAAMVCGGRESTLPLTMEESLYHCRMARRGVRKALLVADLPFLSYQVSIEDAMRNAGRFFKEAEVGAVKLEGGAPIAAAVKSLVQAGMPVMGHLGLTPQSIRKLGGYTVQARDRIAAEQLLEDALILQDAGVFALVLEKIPREVAKNVTARLDIPTIGIGAGPDCDGQILVTYDMLGMFEAFNPKFVRQYANLATTIRQAVSQYRADVRSGSFPGDDESF